MEFFKIKEEVEVLDLTEDSDGEEINEIKKEEIPQSFGNTYNVKPIVDQSVDIEFSTQNMSVDLNLNNPGYKKFEVHHIGNKSSLYQLMWKKLKEDPGEVSDTTPALTSRLSIRNVDKSLDQAVEEIRKGGSLSMVASYYGLSEDLIYQTIVSRNVTHEMDILTKSEEISLVKWILRSNKNNSLVLKHHLLEKVGKMKKVLKITPIFARSKFGRIWYEYFLRSNPEIVEHEGVLLLSDKQKQEPKDLPSLYGLKQAVVVLYDFMKQKNFLSTLSGKVSLPDYLRERFLTIESNSTESKDCFSENKYPQLIEKNSPLSIEDVENNPSDSETSISGRSENSDPDFIVKEVSDIIQSTRKQLNPKVLKPTSTKIKRRIEDLKPTCEKCQKSFCNKAKLQRHLFTHIPKELYTVSCYKCLKRFPSKYHFLVHLKITHSDNNHTCSDCGKVFKHQTSLRKHFKQVHCTNEINDSPNNFICDICTKCFKYKNSLKAHITYGHLKENKLYSCNVCNKRFIKHSLMLRHKTRHSKTKPLSCTNCTKSFSRKYLLIQHMDKCKKEKQADSLIDECQKLSQEFMDEIALD